MDGATQRVSEYIRHKGFNLSDISRKTHIPYMALYDSLFNEKRNRDLRVDEFLALCKHLDVNRERRFKWKKWKKKLFTCVIR